MAWRATGRKLKDVGLGESKAEVARKRRKYILAERIYLKDGELWPRLVLSVWVRAWYPYPEKKDEPVFGGVSIVAEIKHSPKDWWHKAENWPAEILWDVPEVLQEATAELQRRLRENDFLHFKQPPDRSEYMRRYKQHTQETQK